MQKILMYEKTSIIDGDRNFNNLEFSPPYSSYYCTDFSYLNRFEEGTWYKFLELDLSFRKAILGREEGNTIKSRECM